MSTAATPVAPTDQTTSPAFIWARLGSLVSILPLGVWTVNHLWDNLSAYRGANEWQAAVTTYSHPLGHLFTLLLVFIPLGIHSIWGVQRLFSFRPNNLRYRYFGNTKYL